MTRKPSTSAWFQKPGKQVKLSRIATDDKGPFESQKDAAEPLAKDLERLGVLQEHLYAENKRSILVVLQAMDTGGKDGTVKHAFEGINPTACQVTSFKVPTHEEAAHDFLWRIHRAVPRRGNIGIFNRSHYEDVLVTRVHDLIGPREVKQRYARINEFEQLLTENGTTILKFFLHISKDEQKKRLEERLANPEKHWKFDEGDILERKRWSDYQRAYEDAMTACSTKSAPWIVVPADRKWFRNWLVARVLVETLEDMAPKPPTKNFNPKKIRVV